MPLPRPLIRTASLLAALAALAALASATAVATDTGTGTGNEAARGPSPLIYPRQTLPITFDYAAHARRGASCLGCHVTAASSTSAGDDLMPGEAACRACHAIDRTQRGPLRAPPPPPALASASAARPTGRCEACHTGWFGGAGQAAEPPRLLVPLPNLKFNHQLHVSRGVACETCHVRVAGESALATEADLPSMALCLGCHVGGGKQPTARCGACHLTLPDGRLKVNLAIGGPVATAQTGKLVPSGSLRGFDAHTPSFRTDHKQAGREETYCLNCHRRSECLDCHNGVVRPLDIHPSDYVSLHGADGRRNTPDCSSCHRNQTFCVGCHQRVGVSSDPEGGVPGHQPHNPFGTGTGVKSFHPPGWARDASGDVIATPRPSSHSFQAKRNIRTCVSCHREETCLECHSADPARGVKMPNGAGFSPHGVGFAGTARCRALASRNRRACIKCHAVDAAELDCH